MKPIISFLLLLQAIIITLNKLATAQFPVESVYRCRDTGNYTTRTDYARNLKTALNQVGMVTKLSGEFYNSSWGGNEAAYAYALCSHVAIKWGANCTECITKLSNTLSAIKCPDQKEAVGWGTNCLIRYSDRKIFGVLDDWVKISLPEKEVVSPDKGAFDRVLNSLASRLQDEESRGERRKAALGSMTFPPHNRAIYGVVQCTPDLSKELCGKCIQNLMTMQQTCCYGKTAAKLFSTNCYFTYSLEEFAKWKPK